MYFHGVASWSQYSRQVLRSQKHRSQIADSALRYLARSAVMAALTQRMMGSLSLSWTQSVVLKDSSRRSSISGAVSAAAAAAAAAAFLHSVTQHSVRSNATATISMANVTEPQWFWPTLRSVAIRRPDRACGREQPASLVSF